MVITIAGRRVDAPGTETPRFPLSQVGSIKKKLIEFLEKMKVTDIISSGAAGADLIALEAAGILNIRRHLILPFARDKFRDTSVIDRPGEWGSIYDSIVTDLKRSNRLIVLNYQGQDEQAYEKTNIAMLEYAKKISEKKSPPDTILALIIWDGKPKNDNDITYHFILEAKKRNFETTEINTLAE